VSLVCGSCTEREKASVDAASGVVGPQGREGSVPRQKPKALSTDAALAGGPARSSRETAARWGGGGAKGPAHQECPIDQPGRLPRARRIPTTRPRRRIKRTRQRRCDALLAANESRALEPSEGPTHRLSCKRQDRGARPASASDSQPDKLIGCPQATTRSGLAGGAADMTASPGRAAAM